VIFGWKIEVCSASLPFGFALHEPFYIYRLG